MLSSIIHQWQVHLPNRNKVTIHWDSLGCSVLDPSTCSLEQGIKPPIFLLESNHSIYWATASLIMQPRFEEGEDPKLGGTYGGPPGGLLAGAWTVLHCFPGLQCLRKSSICQWLLPISWVFHCGRWGIPMSGCTSQRNVSQVNFICIAQKFIRNYTFFLVLFYYCILHFCFFFHVAAVTP